MRRLKMVGIALVASMFLSIFYVVFRIYMDISDRQQDVQTFLRLAVKDSIVNIQTTEEYGLSFMDSSLQDSKDKYEEYLNCLTNSDIAQNDEGVLALLQEFLKDNSSSEGDALFRPMQFGVTYIDKAVFKASLAESMQALIDANFNAERIYDADVANYKNQSNNALRIKTVEGHANGEPSDYGSTDTLANVEWEQCYSTEGVPYNIFVKISDPQIVAFDSSLADEDAHLYQSLYGSNNLEQYISLKEKAGNADLGISTRQMADFFIYYDIAVEVHWTSTTATPLLNKNFLGKYGVPDYYFYSEDPDTPSYAELPGPVVQYSYRYVLLN